MYRARVVKKNSLLFLLGLSLLFSGCQPEGVIPPRDMSDLLADMYLVEGCIEAAPVLQAWDSLYVYGEILEAHGVTAEEFSSSVDYYLHQTNEFVKIHKRAQKKLDQESKALDEKLQAAAQRAETVADDAEESKTEGSWDKPEDLAPGDANKYREGVEVEEGDEQKLKGVDDQPAVGDPVIVSVDGEKPLVEKPRNVKTPAGKRKRLSKKEMKQLEKDLGK